jgi:hypothetical protein
MARPLHQPDRHRTIRRRHRPHGPPRQRPPLRRLGLDAATKHAYANDLADADHLIAVTDNVNQSKGDRGPEEWKPPYTGDWCRYATDWATIKKTWSLTVTQPEYDALTSMLTTC